MRDTPASAQLIQAFVNTVDVETGTDEIDTVRKFDSWLRGQELLRGSRLDARDHALGLRLRAGIREVLGAHVGDEPDPAVQRAADEALRELPVVVTADGTAPGTLIPAPQLPAPRSALAALAVAWSELTLTGDAVRLKRCAEHACAWVFWDTSKNRSGRWCSMRVCGNRAKARRYAARQAAGPGVS
ncbi:CGNR zinc finger domain-containing protein [Streptomyces sp. NPDC101178]|uniref:CGNR zinc finger domain-containing protein n=1 Tax=Streptomyces sp. NPDC101178 TaxID=3366124 RepID=UPI003812D2B1